jgi:hypothetical protein
MSLWTGRPSEERSLLNPSFVAVFCGKPPKATKVSLKIFCHLNCPFLCFLLCFIV